MLDAWQGMVAWLYSEDAIDASAMRTRGAILSDPTYGMWLARPFLQSDLAEAAAWLRGCGLVDGVIVTEDPGPIIVRLTEPGVICAEQLDSDTSRYLESHTAKPAGQSITFGDVTGPVQVAGDHANKVQHIGADAAGIRLLIAGIVEVVRATAPGEAGINPERAAALAAISNGRADKNALERFGRWAVSTAEAGATSGVVAVISSGVTTLLTHLAHLG